MLRKIVRRELREYLVGLRFGVILGLASTLMAIGALVFSTAQDDSMAVSTGQLQGLTDADGNTNLAGIAGSGGRVSRAPAPLAFCAGRAEKELPDGASFFVHELTGLLRRGETEGALGGDAHLDWATVIAVILSFGAGVLTYRSVSGELQDGTLALVLSNPVSRSEVFVGKYLAALLTLATALAASMVLGLLVVRWLSPVAFGAGEWARLGVFFAASLLYLSCAVLIGLLSSVFGRNQVISSATFMFIWAVMVFVVPNLGGVLAAELRDVRRQSRIHGVYATFDEESSERPGENYADGAARERERARARERLRREYIDELVRQVRFGQNLTRVSPAAAFLYSAEEVTGTGVGRLEQFVEHVIDFRRQLFAVVLEADRADPESEHVYWPFNTGLVNQETGRPWFSKRDVNLGAAREFRDPPPRTAEALKAATLDLALLVLYNGLLFIVTLRRFVRQDVTPGSAL